VCGSNQNPRDDGRRVNCMREMRVRSNGGCELRGWWWAGVVDGSEVDGKVWRGWTDRIGWEGEMEKEEGEGEGGEM